MMKCNNAMDMIYDTDELLPMRQRLCLAFHILFCGRCAAHLDRYEQARHILRTNFFPPAPDFSASIMECIDRIDLAYENEDGEENSGAGPVFDIPGGVSTKGWVIVGLIVMLSLTTLFFGNDFTAVALDQGSSFLLPLGLTIGIVLTGYGALFIGSHLKELSERFLGPDSHWRDLGDRFKPR
jgi:hypothetical protein